MRVSGLYIDAVRDPAAFAGNGTIGLEILEELADVDAIFVPFGGGGLACGIASAVRALRPGVKIIACELETAKPFTEAQESGKAGDQPLRLRISSAAWGMGLSCRSYGRSTMR